VAQSQGSEPTPRPGSAAWWRWRATRPRRASTLTPERIVDAAVMLLDAEGLDAFTMRRLGDELGTAAGSLYRHFESRDAVLVAVHDAVIGQTLDFEPPGETWEERVANFARAQRLLLIHRPYLAEIWSTTEQLGPNALRGRERGLKLALESGSSPESAARGYLAILHYTIGFATVEHGLAFVTPETRRATRKHFRGLPRHEYPATRTLADHLTEVTLEQEFELGLQAMITGLQAIVEQQRTGGEGATIAPECSGQVSP
jgi:AcrR family transcriptional regulator